MRSRLRRRPTSDREIRSLRIGWSVVVVEGPTTEAAAVCEVCAEEMSEGDGRRKWTHKDTRDQDNCAAAAEAVEA